MGGCRDYYTFQILTGHECFGTYLARIGRLRGPNCWDCEGDIPDAQAHHFHGHHSRRLVFFEEMEEEDEEISPVTNMEEVVQAFTTSRTVWRVFSKYVGEIMQKMIRATMA